jgi:hypothetical protein
MRVQPFEAHCSRHRIDPAPLQSRRMGQFVLGIRSLLIKLAVFVVMAALLAWALGGTLWPKARSADLTAVGPSAVIADRAYSWQVLVIGRVNAARAQWRLMMRHGAEAPQPVDERTWAEGAGPVVAADRLYFGGRDDSGNWRIFTLNDSVGAPMPDRLAVEQQLARVSAGLPIQDAATVLRQRELVLDPEPGEVDSQSSAADQ